MIVVHEDNLTCGFGAEVVATVAESAGRHVTCRRIARPDTYVPCNFSNQLEVLPSVRRILEAAAEMLNLEMDWEVPAAVADRSFRRRGERGQSGRPVGHRHRVARQARRGGAGWATNRRGRV